MRTLLLTTLTVVTFCVTAASAQQHVVAPDHFTLELPASLELRPGTYSEATEGETDVLNVDLAQYPVVVQPTGTQDAAELPDATLLIVADVNVEGAFAQLNADMSMSEEELEQLDDQMSTGFMQEAQQRGDMHDITWGGTEVVQLEDTQAIRLRFTGTQTGTDDRLVVNTYMIQNNDSMYYLTASYKLDEQDTWVDELGGVVESLRFEKR